MDKDYRPRLSVEISEEQQRDLSKLIPWGVKNKLFCVIVDDVIRLMKEHGQKFLAAVLSKAIGLEDYTSLEIEDDDDK